MPMFGSSTTPFDADVEKITSEMNTQEDWGAILDLCDKVKQTTNGPRDCLKSVMKRVQHKIPHVCLQALTVLDACVNNCGGSFRLEVSSSVFVSEVKSIISHKNTHPRVRQTLRSHIKNWAEMKEFKEDASLNLLVSLSKALKEEGSDTSDNEPSPARRTDSDQRKEADDIAKAIELSLAETSQPKTMAPTPSLYPTMFGSGVPYQEPEPSYNFTRPETRNVRALYDFEAAEDNELTFKAGEIITVLDDSDPNWWKGYNQRGDGLFPANFVTTDLNAQIEDLEKRHVQFDEVVEVTTVPAAPEIVDINEDKINECLQQIQNADPTGENRPDTQEMLILEEQCKAMGPLIDAELEKIDTKHANLVGMNSKVMEALQMYHMLMRESYGGVPKPGPLVTGMSSHVPTHMQGQMFSQLPPTQQVPDAALPHTIPPTGQPLPPPQGYTQQPMGTQPPTQVNPNYQDSNVNNTVPAYLPPPHTYDPNLSTVNNYDPNMSSYDPNMSTYNPNMSNYDPNINPNVSSYSTIQSAYGMPGVHQTPNMYQQPLI